MSYIEDELKAAFTLIAKETAHRLIEPTKTWRHRVTFNINGPFRRGDALVIQVTTNDDAYFWLDGGAIRHARMKPGFARKTQPNSFVASRGAPPFDPAYISKKPIAKIEARNWTDLASKEKQMILQKAIDRVLSGYRIGKATATATRTPSYTP